MLYAYMFYLLSLQFNCFIVNFSLRELNIIINFILLIFISLDGFRLQIMVVYRRID